MRFASDSLLEETRFEPLGPSLARGLHAVENIDVRSGRGRRLRRRRVRGWPLACTAPGPLCAAPARLNLNGGGWGFGGAAGARPRSDLEHEQFHRGRRLTPVSDISIGEAGDVSIGDLHTKAGYRTFCKAAAFQNGCYRRNSLSNQFGHRVIARRDVTECVGDQHRALKLRQ
jgi:hypothetical protein